MITNAEIYEQDEESIVIDVDSESQGGVTLSLTYFEDRKEYYVDAFLSCIEDDIDDFDIDAFRKELLPWLDKMNIKYELDVCSDMFMDKKNANKLVKAITKE